jgi:membrane associated rhomboid family serine protease
MRTVIFFGAVILTRLAAFIVIGFFIVLQIIEAALAVESGQQAHGQGSGVAFFAHIEGFALGVLLGLLVKLYGLAQPASPASANRLRECASR